MTIVDLHPEELFDRLEAGTLTVSERARLIEHARACEVCRFEVSLRGDFAEELRSVAVREPDIADVLGRRPAAGRAAPDARLRRGALWVAAACVAAAVAASVGFATAVVREVPWAVAIARAPARLLGHERPRAPARAEPPRPPQPARHTGTRKQVAVETSGLSEP